MYKPDLIVKSTGTFYMYSEMNSTVNFPSLWTSKEIDTDRNKHMDFGTPKIEFRPELQPWREKREVPEKRLFINAKIDPDRNRIPILLFNVGMGVAKNIKIKWEYETKNIMQLLKNYYQDKVMYIKPTFDCSDGLNMVEKIDYITPSKLGSEEFIENIFLPYDFQKYFNIYMACLNVESIKASINVPNISKTLSISPQILQDTPELYLNIYYHDLANYTHHKKFKISFKIENHDFYPSISESRSRKLVNMDNIKIKFNINEIIR